MNYFLLALSLIYVFVSCELSTEQETALNRDTSELINARNRGDALSYLNYTHPLVVKHYKLQGDSIFKARFQEVEPKTNHEVYFPEDEILWRNSFYRSFKSNDSIIQVEIEISLSEGREDLDSTVKVYGITGKENSKWLFVEERDYYADYFPKELRLFERSIP
ncbi:MAG: hypothetical protein R3277_06250 [Brumimicrobium sp.]|nr:hypothetical protein [Brumimicrobium sp.]